MDQQTADRLELLEKKMDVVGRRLDAIERAIDELRTLLRGQGIKPGKNVAAP
jgi:hypothetical protein